MTKFHTTGPDGMLEKSPTTTSSGATAGDVVGLNGSAQIDATLLPTGIGAETANILASEALSAGAWVNVYSNAGTANVRNADGSTTGKLVNGFVLASVLSGGTATVFLAGINNQVTGQTPGKVYLSDSTPGAGAAAQPTTAGHVVQLLGVAVSATQVAFQPHLGIVLA